jgi:hypothetical protein
MAYQPSAEAKQKALRNGDYIPVTFIPRKPHPNGLLAYLLASFIVHPLEPTRRLPFILDLLPHLRVGDVTSGNAFRLFRSRWFLESKPHFISDSAFGSFDEMFQVHEWGALWTTSMPSTSTPFLWNALSYNCGPNTWKAVLNSHGIIASSHTIIVEETKKIVRQQVLTNGFDVSYHAAYGVAIDATIPGILHIFDALLMTLCKRALKTRFLITLWLS